jgi:hypothetical protein
MSYEGNDLGYDLGYDLIADSPTADRAAAVGYRMDNVEGARGQLFKLLGDIQSGKPPKVKPTEEQPAQPAKPDPASQGKLNNLEGSKKPGPDAPVVGGEGPATTTVELAKAKNEGDMVQLRDRLTSDKFSFSEQEANRIVNVYRQGGAGEISGKIDKALESVGKNAGPGTRRGVASGVIRDDVLKRDGENLQARFAAGEISSEEAQAYTAQIYREEGVDVDANPPNLDKMLDPKVQENVNARIKSFGRTNPDGKARAGDDNVTSLRNASVAEETAQLKKHNGPIFQEIDKGHYGNRAQGEKRVGQDTDLFLTHRKISDKPHEIRALRLGNQEQLKSGLSQFHTQLGSEGTANKPANEFRTRLVQEQGKDKPPDTSKLTAADQREVAKQWELGRVGEHFQVKKEERDQATKIGDEKRAEADKIRTEERTKTAAIETEIRAAKIAEAQAAIAHERSRESSRENAMIQMMTQLITTSINNLQQGAMAVNQQQSQTLAQQVQAGDPRQVYLTMLQGQLAVRRG